MFSKQSTLDTTLARYTNADILCPDTGSLDKMRVLLPRPTTFEYQDLT
jgi:hypothetical protein